MDISLNLFSDSLHHEAVELRNKISRALTTNDEGELWEAEKIVRLRRQAIHAEWNLLGNQLAELSHLRDALEQRRLELQRAKVQVRKVSKARKHQQAAKPSGLDALLGQLTPEQLAQLAGAIEKELQNG